MIRQLLATAALCTTFGCSDSPAETALPALSPDAFAGAWRSVTPSVEFIRLSVHSKSSEMGVLGARLTFSGVVWEGGGRIEGDSLVVDMTMAGISTSSGVLVAHTLEAGTLRVRLRASNAAVTDLRFVREN